MRLVALLALLLLLDTPPQQAQAQPFSGTTWCNESVVYDTNTNGSTLLASQSGGVSICGYVIASAAAVSVKLEYGTSVKSACDTNPVAITPPWTFQASSSGIASIVDNASNYRGLSVPGGFDLCINTSAGESVQAIVYYYQQR
jgi:hypothetical protein